MHGLDCTHCVIAPLPGRFEVEHVSQTIQKFWRGIFRDPHSAIALHIAMSANRAGPRSLFADVATQQKEIDDFLHIAHGVFMLGHAHGPSTDDGVGLHRNICGLLNLWAVNATPFDNFIPRNGT
jgi:hypothetical protein